MITFTVEALVERVGATRNNRFADGKTNHSRDLVLRDPEPRDGSKYPPATLCVTFWGERIGDLDDLMPNDAVRVQVSGKSVEKEGTNRRTGAREKYWTTRLSGIEVERLYGEGRGEGYPAARRGGGGDRGGQGRGQAPGRRDEPRRTPDDDEDVPF